MRALYRDGGFAEGLTGAVLSAGFNALLSVSQRRL